MLIFIDSNCLKENNIISNNNNRLETGNPYYSTLIMLIAHVNVWELHLFLCFRYFFVEFYDLKKKTQRITMSLEWSWTSFLLKLKAPFVWHIWDFCFILFFCSPKLILLYILQKDSLCYSTIKIRILIYSFMVSTPKRIHIYVFHQWNGIQILNCVHHIFLFAKHRYINRRTIFKTCSLKVWYLVSDI